MYLSIYIPLISVKHINENTYLKYLQLPKAWWTENLYTGNLQQNRIH